MPRRLRLALAVLLLAAPPALAADYVARSGGPSSEAMLARHGEPPAPRLDFFRPVLSGVLYRAGFHGGDKARTGLTAQEREVLCAAGFSEARYADFGRSARFGVTDCAEGRLTYAAARSGEPGAVMRSLHEIITTPGRGPMLVHCMWGVHASGALSAMALVQFCGWSEERAKAYWDAARNEAPCSGGCAKWIDAKFDRFRPDPALEITAAQSAAICPQ
jgi:hypothetical protein